MSDPTRDWKEWIRKGDEDRLNIENNLKAEQIPWATVIFHAQQAAEKYLKALLVYFSVEPKRTHDLRSLCNACASYDPAVLEFEEDCGDLNYLSEDIRYPNIPEASEEDMGRRAVAASDRICAAIRERIN